MWKTISQGQAAAAAAAAASGGASDASATESRSESFRRFEGDASSSPGAEYEERYKALMDQASQQARHGQ